MDYCEECEREHREEVKELMEQLKAKTQECEELKKELDLYKTWYRAKHDDIKNTLGRYHKALEEIEEIVKQTCRKRCTNDCLGTKKHCGYGAIFNIINKVKGITMFWNKKEKATTKMYKRIEKLYSMMKYL